MPRYLTEQDIADFRAELCKVATERFARHGYEGVTMRQLAEALGANGYINDYPTGRLLRDAKLYEIGAGTSEIRRMLIGRELFAETA